jgi:hypothetical protein
VFLDIPYLLDWFQKNSSNHFTMKIKQWEYFEVITNTQFEPNNAFISSSWNHIYAWTIMMYGKGTDYKIAQAIGLQRCSHLQQKWNTHTHNDKMVNTLRQNVESMIRTFCDYVFTLIYSHIRHVFMTIRLFYQKYDYIIKLWTIYMNFNMCMTTSSHFSHLD